MDRKNTGGNDIFPPTLSFDRYNAILGRGRLDAVLVRCRTLDPLDRKKVLFHFKYFDIYDFENKLFSTSIFNLK